MSVFMFSRFTHFPWISSHFENFQTNPFWNLFSAAPMGTIGAPRASRDLSTYMGKSRVHLGVVRLGAQCAVLYYRSGVQGKRHPLIFDSLARKILWKSRKRIRKNNKCAAPQIRSVAISLDLESLSNTKNWLCPKLTWNFPYSPSQLYGMERNARARPLSLRPASQV